MKLSTAEAPLPKCYFTHCKTTRYTDQHRPPTKRQPFKAINAYAPAHTVCLLLPEEVYAVVEAKLNERKFSYARVYMPLLDIVSGDFFNQYIKAGNVMMLSEGRLGIENTFSLKDGILRLHVDKATYERCGLVGKAVTGMGRKHVKSRFLIELDLRQASMKDGKKGFERIKWAFKNVLDMTLTWLFIDLEHDDNTSGPIAQQHPQIHSPEPVVTRLKDVVTPFVNSDEALHDQLYEEQLLEWLGLAVLESTRISTTDSTDSYLCRYALPDEVLMEDDTVTHPQNIVHVRWHGFMSSTFLQHLWLTLHNTGPIDDIDSRWFSITAATFASTSFTVLCTDESEILLWECD